MPCVIQILKVGEIMFEAFKSWLNELNEAAQSFNHPEDDAIHVALASLLYHIVAADQAESDKEKDRFCKLMMSEFDLNQIQIGVLYSYVKQKDFSLEEELQVINKYLKEEPVLRMRFFDKLNQLMNLDGVTDTELEVFNTAVKSVFPDIQMNN